MPKDYIEDLKREITTIPKDKNYYFVRTEGGELYDDFVKKSRIGIQYTYITESDFSNLDDSKIRTKIKNFEKFKTDKIKGQITTIVNKLKIFRNLKEGDVVIIPSKNSDRLYFGEIKSKKVLYEEVSEGEYEKFKEVKWIKEKNFRKLDANFIKIKNSHHVISDVEYLSPYIEREIKSLYIDKEYNSHLVFDFKKQEDIPLTDLVEFLQEYRSLAQLVVDKYNLKEDVDSVSIKLNLQSEGQVSVTQGKRKNIVIVTAFVIAAIASSAPSSLSIFNEKDPTSDQELIDAVKSLMGEGDDLDMDRNKIQDFF